jgi:hypothetical protein
MNGIVITTHKSTELFYIDAMLSLRGCKYPIAIAYNTDEDNQYENKGLKMGMDLFEDFVFLHDTVVIKDLSLFDRLFEYKGIVSISPRFLSYLGKFNSEILKQKNIPEVKTKRDAYETEMWLRRAFPTAPCFDRTFVDGNHRFEEIHGRMNMVLENNYLRKMKPHQLVLVL